MIYLSATIAFLISLISAASASPVIPISNPCALTESFQSIHMKIDRLTKEANDMGNTAERLHHTSRWRPYRRIEVEWSDIHAHVLALLIELSDFPIALDTTRDNQRKQTAENLILAYQNTLENIITYASIALYLEHTENDLATNTASEFLEFGSTKMEVPQTYNAIAKNHFVAHFATVDNAARSLTIPERHYYTLCPSMNAPSRLQNR
jgi:hypothetical protein